MEVKSFLSEKWESNLFKAIQHHILMSKISERCDLTIVRRFRGLGMREFNSQESSIESGLQFSHLLDAVKHPEIIEHDGKFVYMKKNGCPFIITSS
jgi:hypothetical protein